MGAYTQLTYHIVFATKYRRPTIVADRRERFYEYIGGIVRGLRGSQLEIGGTDAHIHMLLRLPATIALADCARDIKANSSRWMHETFAEAESFEWQKGYGAFTVSYSQIEIVQRYLRNQEVHHRHRSFQEEYVEILKRHDIPFRLEYLFEDEHHG